MNSANVIGAYAPAFYGTGSVYMLYAVGMEQNGSDVWIVDDFEFPDEGLPSYGNSDNGKFLGINTTNGSAMWLNLPTCAPTPMIVTMTPQFDNEDNLTGFVGDKTYAEVLAAKKVGKHVVLLLADPEDGTDIAVDVVFAGIEEGAYMLVTMFPERTELGSATGSDYVTISFE